jgi:hypothetical protein
MRKGILFAALFGWALCRTGFADPFNAIFTDVSLKGGAGFLVSLNQNTEIYSGNMPIDSTDKHLPVWCEAGFQVGLFKRIVTWVFGGGFLKQPSLFVCDNQGISCGASFRFDLVKHKR